MKIKIPEKLWHALGGANTLKSFGCSGRELGWEKYAMLDLTPITDKRLARLYKLIEPHKRIRGASIALADIKTWRKAISGEDADLKPRSVEHFVSLLTTHLRGVDGQRIYLLNGSMSEAYYVNRVRYLPPQDRSNYRSPPMASIELLYNELGRREECSETFYAEDCLHLTVQEALARKGYFCETPELRKRYLASMKRYDKIDGKIGKQLWRRRRHRQLGWKSVERQVGVLQHEHDHAGPRWRTGSARC